MEKELEELRRLHRDVLKVEKNISDIGGDVLKIYTDILRIYGDLLGIEGNVIRVCESTPDTKSDMNSCELTEKDRTKGSFSRRIIKLFIKLIYLIRK